MNKVPALTAMLLATLVAGSASADRSHHRGWGKPPAGGYGRVVHVRPVYRTVEVLVPEQRCIDGNSEVAPTDPDRAALAGAVVGGLIGGIAGNQLGKGNGRTVMTVAGGVLGATIGYQAAPGAAELLPDTQLSWQRCETVERVETREELLEYRVKYRYRGHVYHTRTEHHPGKRIRVDRRARPIHF